VPFYKLSDAGFFENYLAYASPVGGTFARRVGYLRPELLPR
jgi:hypothetical protein